MTLLCITNQMPDWRSCTIRGEHTVRCDGWEYRHNEERGREEATGRECRGCLPRLAEKGLLCWSCWERVEEAFIKWTPFAELVLSRIDRAVQRDTGGRTSGPQGYVPIPGTKLAVDEIRSYLRGSAESAEAWVSTVEGAKNAVRFARAVPAALRTHELEEKAHKIVRTRCPKCRQLSLDWKPPAKVGAHVSVVCRECGEELPQASFEKVAAIENPDLDAAASVLIDGGHTVNRSGYFAEDYDPAAPEHAALDPLEALHMAELRPLALEHGVDERAVVRLRKTDLIAAIRATEPEPRKATA